MKKACQITMHYFPPSGGQDVYVQQLIKCLESNSYEQRVLQPAKSNSRPPAHVRYAFRIPLMGKIFDGFSWWWFNQMLKLNKKFLKSQDVLISHYPFHYPPLAFHQNVIVISHGVDWPERAKTLFDQYKIKAAKSLVALSKKNVTIVANDTDFLRRIGYKVPAASHYYQEIAPHVWFIPNNIDPKEFFPTKLPKKEIILVPRNIRKSRGIDLAIQAFSGLVNEEVFQNYQLVVAGGPLHGRYYKKCLELVNKLKLQKKVDFLGNVSQNNLKKLYHEAMLTLIPTRAYEGTSLSALESMASGTPVVSTRVGGLADLPTAKSEMTVMDLTKTIKEVLSHREKFAKKQRQTTIEQFSYNLWSQAWTKVLAQSNRSV